MSEVPRYLDEKIKLNTIELEKWQNPYWNIEDYTNEVKDWNIFDEEEKDFFSLENIKESFWKNYKDTILKIKQPNWEEKEIKISWIINWWMWTNVSSRDMVQAMNDIWFWGHLSSIWIGFYYFEDNFEGFYDKKNKEQNLIVEEEFTKIFENELWLTKDFLNKHFFVCNELVKDWEEQKRNTGFNWELWNEKYTRMMDLIAIYREVKNLKNKWNTVWLNAMYKTSSYIATLKIASLCWIDYVTTAAWNPDKNPKEFLKEFYSDLEEENIGYEIPAYWLLISMDRAVKDFDYDYYIFEDWHKAGGHVIKMKWTDKYKQLPKIKARFEKAWKRVPPIFAAWWVDSNKEVKKALELWFDWIQIGTSVAVSEEAVNWKWDIFKKRLIAWNHLWPKTEEDIKYEEFIDNEYDKFKKQIKKSNRLILKYLNKNLKESDEDFEITSEKINLLKDYIFKIIYKDFYNEEVEELNEEEQKMYNLVNQFLQEKFNWDLDEINKMIRNYGNSMKFVKEFDEFLNNNDTPTHLVFDSTVGFPWRTKIFKWIIDIVAWKIKSSKCVNCLTDCILANRWPSKEDKSSTFCIYDWLDQTNNNKPNIAFSGLSTVPYSDIRPIKDIMAYYMWTYIKR